MIKKSFQIISTKHETEKFDPKKIFHPVTGTALVTKILF